MRDELGLLDLLVIVVLVLAAVAGWRRSGRGEGSSRAGRVLGALVLLGAVSGLAVRLSHLGDGPVVRLLLLLAGLAGIAALGAAAGGWLGRIVGTGLARARLGLADRALGAVAGTAVAAVVLVLLGLVVQAAYPDLGGSTVLHGLRSLAPAATGSPPGPR